MSRYEDVKAKRQVTFDGKTFFRKPTIQESTNELSAAFDDLVAPLIDVLTRFARKINSAAQREP